MRKFLIISDIHLNSEENTHTDKAISDYFKKYLSKGYYIFLVGDILDVIRNELIKRKREYLAIKGLYPETINLIENNNKIIYIIGNHDTYLEKKNILNCHKYFDYIINNFSEACGTLPGSLALQCNGTEQATRSFKIHFEHGHNYDLPNGKCHYVGDTIACCWGNLKNACKNNCSDEFFDNLQTIEQIDNTHKKLKKASKKLLKDYNMVIMGHSHKPYLRINKNKCYINSGSFNKELIDETKIKIKNSKIYIIYRERNIETNKKSDKVIYSLTI